MALHPLIRPWGLILMISGLAQSVVWIVGSILCILLYTKAMEPTKGSTYSQLLFTNWYSTFFRSVDFALTVTNHVFNGFAIAYLVLSIWWLLTSAYLFYYIRLKRWQPIKHVLIAHCIIVTFISIIDLVFMSLLADDYHAYEKVYNQELNATLKPQDLLTYLNSTYTLTVMGIMIMIAARGIVLWFFNVASIFYALFLICQQLENERLPTILYNIPIDAYNEYPSVENPTTYDNNGFVLEHASTANGWETYPKNPSQYGKPNKPAVPLKPKSPLIPLPDYSPPGTPKNLRSTSNNISPYF